MGTMLLKQAPRTGMYEHHIKKISLGSNVLLINTTGQRQFIIRYSKSGGTGFTSRTLPKIGDTVTLLSVHTGDARIGVWIWRKRPVAWYARTILSDGASEHKCYNWPRKKKLRARASEE